MDAEIATFQYRRIDTLFQKGIKSLSDLEEKRLKKQQTNAYLITAQNKLEENRNEVNNAQIELQSIDAEYINKVYKAESDKFTTLSSLYGAKGEVDKLQNQYNNYQLRNDMYYVIAPQSGYITKAMKSGIGEILKEGDKIVSIVPYERELAVELYARPMDLPLINLNQEVRLVFDGWQAFIISGWTGFSFGTYSGEVVAIDNVPNDNSQYRILIKTNSEEMPFPELLRIGTGVRGIAILKDVPVWYEVWRQLNGFPADFYEEDMERNKTRFKSPVKAVAK